MQTFFSNAIMNYSIAFGVIIGGCIVGGISASIIGRPPFSEMERLASTMKIWAVVTAIGGTFDTIENLERGFLSGSLVEVLKQILLIGAAMAGAHMAGMTVHLLTRVD
ncbi:YtrH family sporulation protein [Sporolactobacillus sp. Y61]|jgi:hypothetical protein|uniref:YtrH family sporulation protein n=1 Tax=Sporolactobacillus sp. Y61 TaxID=3160863 RepID=A0AAU8IFG0_9BACL|nr:YtrH family sporulation protein [Sporolactobacillus sp. THM19-2]RYL94599.1 sporulation protein [Sporolactobacillus sp. THM19-2]